MDWNESKSKREDQWYVNAHNTEKEDGRKRKLILHSLWFLFGVWLFGSLTNTLLDEMFEEDLKYVNGSFVGRTRSKRFIYMSNDRRMNLPPGSLLDMESTASLPGLNPLPLGFGSETAISVPFDVDFDTLGLTSEDNKFGEIPFLNTMLGWLAPIRNFTTSFRESFEAAFNKSSKKFTSMSKSSGGGHRSILYQVIEDALYNFGINGKACLLRAICEIHDEPLFGHGLVGEILELFLSVSSSTNAFHVLGEYLEAEIKGKSATGCAKYKNDCPLSLFGPLSEKHKFHEEKIRQKFMDDESNYADYHLEGENNGNRITRDVLHKMKSNVTEMKTLSREKRFLFFGPAGSLRLPLGSIFVIKPQLKLPWMTNLPDGYKSGLAIGIPLRVIFDDLGLTSLLNPLFRIPFANVAGRRRRSTWKPLPGVNYAGGDREFIYDIVEHTLDTWGLDGHTCLLRAVCEMHLAPLSNHGLFGEVLELFLTPSKSLHAKLRIKEYIEAESLGKIAKYCKPFHDGCPYSLFISSKDKENRITEAKTVNKLLDSDDAEAWM